MICRLFKMNFMEAILEMKKGRKITTKSLNGFIVIRDYSSAFQIFPDGSEETKDFNLDDIEAVDWEVVDDDENWELADYFFEYNKEEPHFRKQHVKKCRDIIIKDFENWKEPLSQDLYDIINKRFGYL